MTDAFNALSDYVGHDGKSCTALTDFPISEHLENLQISCMVQDDEQQDQIDFRSPDSDNCLSSTPASAQGAKTFHSSKGDGDETSRLQTLESKAESRKPIDRHVSILGGKIRNYTSRKTIFGGRMIYSLGDLGLQHSPIAISHNNPSHKMVRAPEIDLLDSISVGSIFRIDDIRDQFEHSGWVEHKHESNISGDDSDALQ